MEEEMSCGGIADASGNLKELAYGIYEKMKAYPSKYGFHFSYSPESCWRPDTRFLLLTINPQAKDSKGNLVKIEPSTPWPESNDFFNPDNIFRLKKPVQTVCYELSRLVENPAYQDLDPLEAAKRFVDENAVIASLVPFRTENVQELDEGMLEFARNDYWGEIFKVWQPEVILTFGSMPFQIIADFLKEKFRLMENGSTPIENDGQKNSLVYRHAIYEKSPDKTIILLGLPHPAARGAKGMPTNFPGNANEDSPLRQFLQSLIRS